MFLNFKFCIFFKINYCIFPRHLDPTRYHLVDTAQCYENEAAVPTAFSKGVEPPPDRIFITTKLWNSDHGYENALKSCKKSLKKIGGKIDLFLMHSPFGEEPEGSWDGGRKSGPGKIVETWDAMLECKSLGLVKSVGVSNFGVPHLEALRKHGREMPAVNQIELHPLNWRSRIDLLDYCQKHKIILTAYGSLFKGDISSQMEKENKLFEKIAQKHNKTPHQVLLRWGLQMGFCVLTRSRQAKRIEQNADIFGDFCLDDEDMEAICGLEQRGIDQYWNPVEHAEVDLGDLNARKK